MSNLDILNKISKEEIITRFDPICIRQKSNWSKANKKYRFDSGVFEPELLLNDINTHSPKLNTLLRKIKNLDEKDEKKYGKKFKHFIFSDIKSGNHGAKMIASALLASGYNLGYYAELLDKDDDDDDDDDDDFSHVDVESLGKEEFPKLNIKSLGKTSKKTNNKTPDLSNYYNISKGGSKKQLDENEENDSDNKIWGPIIMKSDNKLKKEENNFFLLSSVSVYDKPISVKMKKDILAKFNERPTNTNGDLVRFIVMDSGFKEGIDLFDIKYIHIFEPSVNLADQKQVIGRGTRTCGQKGLDFDTKQGWPLYVFIYDLEIPDKLQKSLMESKTAFELYTKSLHLDIRLLNFGYEIERVSIIGSIDYILNENVHNFSIDIDDEDNDEHTVLGGRKNNPSIMGGSHEIMREYISKTYAEYTWPTVKMENLCETKGGNTPTILKYTPSQDFIRHYFSPKSSIKGMLLNWSVGTGKTAAAIAAASTNFEPEGYTILWVTRTTLKNDIWKNMFGQVANESIRNMILNGETIPTDSKKQMQLLSNSWRIRPISYKQFSNLVSKKNEYYKRLVKENGEADPLRKTLLIIDEAHKLYGGGDLSSIERPDMVALHDSLMRSYAISGDDSVRLLLMTATPITESPMELVKILNLCKPLNEQMPDTFEQFSEEYLDENGHFTGKGQVKYLNEIAGYVSYLNREKDARQFAQPIIKRINTPIISDNDMKKVDDYDRFITREKAEEGIHKLKENLEKESSIITDEIEEMGKERFTYLKDICNDTTLPKMKCNKIVNRNINAMMKDIKGYIKSIKEQMKVIRTEIQKVAKYKTNAIERIKKNIEKNPEKFENYKKSTYYSLRTECSETNRINKEFQNDLLEHPSIIEINKKINDHKEHIDMLKNRLKLDGEVYKGKLKQLREFMKMSSLSELEKSVIRLNIRDLEKEHKKTVKIYNKENKEIVDEDNKSIKLLENEKKDVYKRLNKTMKMMIKQEKKELDTKKKEEKALRKTMRKQGLIKEEIKNEKIKGIVDDYEKNIDRELMYFGEEILQEEDERKKKTEEKKNKTRKLKEEQRKEKEQKKKEQKEQKEQKKKEQKEQKEEQRKEEQQKKKEQKKKEQKEQKEEQRKKKEQKEQKEQKEKEENNKTRKLKKH